MFAARINLRFARFVFLVAAALLSPFFDYPESASGSRGSRPDYGQQIAIWKPEEPLGTPRAWHAAVLLLDGRVLVVGGYNGQYLASAELYDPVTGKWTLTGSMNEPRRAFSATLLADGRVLAAGGRFHDGTTYQYLASAELYDPSTGEWTRVAPMKSPRQYHTATLLGNGQVLVTGGYFRDGEGYFHHHDSAEFFDPQTGTWLSAESMSAARGDHTATLLEDGRVLVAGGMNTQFLSSAELFDPADGSWIPVGSMATARRAHSASLLKNGSLLVAGGYNGEYLASAELYDPADGVWISASSMEASRDDHSATLLLDGRVLVAGGSSEQYPAQAETYNPVTNTWVQAGALAEPREWHTATRLPDGRVLVTGGCHFDGSWKHLESVEIFQEVFLEKRLYLPVVQFLRQERSPFIGSWP
jgi:N-acetylneuraminic acid mutarotase